MRGLLSWSVVTVTVCVLATECGNGKLQTPGRVVKAGQPLLPKEDESVRVTFVPILPDGTPPADHYFEKKRDVLGGKFDENRSPFVFEIDSRTPELVIDLDHPPR